MTTIAYDLPRSASVDLRIYDVAGRLVRVLKDGVVETPGRHHVKWNGRDGGDRLVAAGLYFYRMRADDFEQTRRMMLVK